MSLINDALKKAQKQRTGDAPSLGSMPAIGGEPAARIAKRSKPAGFNTLMIRAGIGAGVLVVLVIGGYFAFRSSPSTKPVAVTATTTPAPVATAPSPTPGPATQPAVSSPAFTLPLAPKVEPAAPKVE